MEKFRLVTRSDFDGLVCAAILKDLNMIDDIKFVHPKDMQDGKIEITDNDITTNLPYVEGVYLAIDHHLSEATRVKCQRGNHIIDPDSPSAASVLHNYFIGNDKLKGSKWEEIIEAVDKADSAQFSKDEIINPQGWVLLNYLMDARTGLGRFREFRISNYTLMMELIDKCIDLSIDEILELPDVQERVDLYYSLQEKFIDQVKRCATVHKNLVILDLKGEEIIYPGNRFVVYALYPECNISIHVLWGLKKQNTVFATGKSILNRTSKTNIGDLMLQYNGGGHLNAGTCQIENDKADEVLKELIEKINADG